MNRAVEGVGAGSVRTGARCWAAGFLILASCSGFSPEPGAGEQMPGTPGTSTDDGGTTNVIPGEGVVSTISLKVAAGKNTWVRNRPNSVKFTVTRGDKTVGAVAVTVAGLPVGSTADTTTVEDGVTEGSVTFKPGPEATPGDQTFTLEGALVGNAKAKSSVPVTGVLRGAPGDLDTSFATNGVITLPADAASAVNSDGKIYVFRRDLTTERYAANGTLDTSFLTNGRGSYPTYFGEIHALYVSGASVYALFWILGGTGYSGAVYKTSLDGIPDTAFGSNGSGLANSASTGYFSALARSASGQIAIVGPNNSIPRRATVDWFSPSGAAAGINDGNTTTIDKIFTGAAWDGSGLLVVGGDTLGRMGTGTQHYTFTNFPNNGRISLGADVALYGIDLEGSNIVVSGIQASSGEPFIAKLTPNGAGAYPGFSFQPPTVFFETGLPTRAVLLGDGSLLQVGRQRGGMSCAVTRYDATGKPDSNFGTNGVAVLAVSPCAPANISVQPDGKIVVDAGSRDTTPASTRIVRLWN